MSNSRWTREQVILAMHLYCQLPFGKLHQHTPEIQKLAALIDRTPSAVAMKCSNLASLDPAITNSGRSGLSSASNLDRDVWTAFEADWENLALECHRLLRHLQHNNPNAHTYLDNIDEDNDFTGETRKVFIEQRIKQTFFRKAVLSSYHERCCMSGASEPRLLIASHIIPWKTDRSNRLNPRNGLCLSALHDKAFDNGLISLSDDFKVLVSETIKNHTKDHFINSTLIALAGQKIELPEKFSPSPEFIRYHRINIFLG